MANEIIFREGFDTYNALSTEVGLLTKWSRYDTISSLIAGRFGGQALRVKSGSTSTRHGFAALLDSPVSSFSVGAALRASTSGATNSSTTHLRLMQSITDYQVGVRLNLDRSLSVMRQTGRAAFTILGTSAPNVWDESAWFYLEWEGVLSNTVGESRLYVNGNPTPVLSLTGVDTINVGSTVSYIDIGHGSNGSLIMDQVDFDDIYVKEGATRLGPQKITTLRVDGDSTPQMWVPSTGTDHAAMVDETLANTTDWVAGNAVDDIEQFTLGNITGYPAAIHEVNAIAYARNSDSMTRAIEFGVQSGAANSVEEWYLGASWARRELPVPLNPNGNIPWDRDAINALKARLKVTV